MSGTVTDAHTLQPISGVRVSFSGGSTNTDANGQYTFTGVAEGTYTVAASAANYASQGATVTVGPGAMVVQNLALPPNPATIVGTITDASTNQPVSNPTVGYGGPTSATTNSAGQYSLSNVTEGSYTVVISASGYTSQSRPVTVGPGASATVNAALPPNPGNVTGTVTDSGTAQPINGATVSDGATSTTTNGNGVYTFINLAEGGYTVSAVAPGYASQTATITVGPGATLTQNFALQPNPATISGVVSDSVTAQAVLGASVSASGVPGTLTTNGAGQFTLSSLAAGTYLITVTASGYQSQTRSVAVTAGATSTQNFVLIPNPGSISGTVTDASTKQPLGGASVTLSGNSTPVTTSADGSYSFTSVAEGSYSVTANATGYAGQSATVGVGPGAAVSQNVSLQPNPGTITGTVTDGSTAQPLSSASVTLAAGPTGTTNSAGQYTLTGVAEGTYTVSVTATGYATTSLSITVGPGTTITQNFALQPNPGTITGAVTDASTNQAVSGATVSYSGGSATTSAAGMYTLNNVPEGSYTVTVSATGYASQSPNVSVGPGGTTSQNVALQPNPGSITGTITDASSKQPIQGATAADGTSTTTTNAAGQYSFSSLAEGGYTITISATNYGGQSQPVQVGPGAAVTQNFALQPNPGTLSGTVTDAGTKQALANATVTYASSSTTTNALGQYIFASVPEGTYAVTAAATNYASSSPTVAVGAGAAVTQDFALQPLPGSVTGIVTDASTAKPIALASVNYSGGSTTTNASGAYTLSAVPVGSYTVTASGTGYTSQNATVSVSPASTVSQGFTLQPNPGTITGTITDAVSAQPITGATVSYLGGLTTTNSVGQYAFSNVAEGSYTVTASAAVYANQSHSVTVGPGSTVIQNLALAPNPGSVNGTVTAATTGQAIQNATVSYAGGSATTNAAGQFTLAGVTEGTYTLTAAATGYGNQSQVVVVGPAASVTQNFSLKLALLFSDGFETGSFSNWTSNSGLTLETATVHSGTYASEGATANGVTYAYKKLSTSYAGVYTRLYFQVKSQAGGFTLVSDETGTNGAWIARLYVNSTGQLCLWDNPSPFICGSTISLGVWHAAELHVIVNGASSTTEVWLDGILVSSMSSQTVNLGTTNVGAVRVGDAATGRTYDVIFDDVVASLARIGL